MATKSAGEVPSFKGYLWVTHNLRRRRTKYSMRLPRKNGRKTGRFRMALLAPLIAMGAAGCGMTTPSGSSATVSSPPAADAPGVLSAADVKSIVETAAASVNVPLVIAVTDRSGNVLAIYKKANAPLTATANFGMVEPSDQVAVSLALSTAFFSNDTAPLSTRTIRFASASQFPPASSFNPSGPFYGIENTNQGCGFNVTYLPGQSLPVPTALTGGPGPGIITGKPDELDTNNLTVNPGGVPIYKNGEVAGGIGVAGAEPATVEFAAVSGTVNNGFALMPSPPGMVFINGFALPFVSQTTLPAGESPGAADGSYELPPQPSPGPTPEGDLIAETGSTQGGLTLAQVQTIVQNTIATGSLTRAVLRLPEGARASFVIAVADLNGNLLALYRMQDAAVFAIDVAVAKARNAIYFSTATGELAGVPAGTAVTTRTIGFGTQPFYPSGINGTEPGPFFDLYQYDVANPCTQGHQPANPNQNGVVFFPGSVPLFVNGKLVGGLGVSGDGVDQDDWAAAGGEAGFQAPANIRADQIILRGVRLPYQKFPRNPEE
jgi:uncharacterized protein GlcG (DUF336 family)